MQAENNSVGFVFLNLLFGPIGGMYGLVKTYTIDPNNILKAHATREAAGLVENARAFASAKEFEALTKDWPASQLVQLWNSLAGTPPFEELKPVTKFKDRKTATTRIWTAIQRLEVEAPLEVTPPPANLTPTRRKKAKPTTEGTRRTLEAREGTKSSTILALIKRSEGATVDEIAAAVNWQRHSVRGFISGCLVKKMGLKVVIKHEEDRRAYVMGPQ